MTCKVVLACFVVFIIVNTVFSERKRCASTDILCYSTQEHNHFKILITINNTAKAKETRTLTNIKHLLQEVPSVKCILKGCDEDFNYLLKIYLAEHAKIHISKNGIDFNSMVPKEKTVLEYKDVVTLSKNGSENENKPDVSVLDEAELHEEHSPSDIKSIVNHIDSDDHSDNDWDPEQNGIQENLKVQDVPGYPIEFTLFPGNSSVRSHIRSKRAPKGCDLSELKNSYVKCEVWPDLYLCKQKCVFGHGLETSKGTVVKRNHKCRISEGRWKPNGIKDCKPYMNCKVQLKADQEGSLHCKQNDHFKPPSCKIKCGKKSTKHQCSKEMADSLPECASLSQEMSLIKPPSE